MFNRTFQFNDGLKTSDQELSKRTTRSTEAKIGPHFVVKTHAVNTNASRSVYNWEGGPAGDGVPSRKNIPYIMISSPENNEIDNTTSRIVDAITWERTFPNFVSLNGQITYFPVLAYQSTFMAYQNDRLAFCSRFPHYSKDSLRLLPLGIRKACTTQNDLEGPRPIVYGGTRSTIWTTFLVRQLQPGYAKVWRSKEIGSLGPTLIRSPFANGPTFLGFGLASRLLYS
ncbi:uncharacterized protein HD556DRAFT_1314319 [Suillus plorans]|uniref:Uncharacterized protein n=1 Tax=Suillus plorans TaxID=116603 RepID=A0A9P7AC00_9AGAM|nr:uncharacterized protein HD556DRAFT_1314319 [Suillus plorans]KAG1785382.1 hypothetical protein HD556DRAFT_1314319 [Suillus plorans]